MGEGTFAGTRGNDEDAPIAALRSNDAGLANAFILAKRGPDPAIMRRDHEANLLEGRNTVQVKLAPV
jgi:hypothetical protein